MNKVERSTNGPWLSLQSRHLWVTSPSFTGTSTESSGPQSVSFGVLTHLQAQLLHTSIWFGALNSALIGGLPKMQARITNAELPAKKP